MLETPLPPLIMERQAHVLSHVGGLLIVSEAFSGILCFFFLNYTEIDVA